MCSVQDCASRVFSRGWCSKHYTRWQRHGDPLVTARTPPLAAGATEKWCPKCRGLRPIADFKPRPSGRLRGYCDPCQAVYDVEYAQTSRGRGRRVAASQKWSEGPRKEYDLQWRYGLTLAQYEALVTAQGNRCAICRTDKPGGNSRRWCVDHCHDSLTVRGLLCMNCNMGLGQFRDDPGFLRAAAEYIERHMD